MKTANYRINFIASRLQASWMEPKQTILYLVLCMLADRFEWFCVWSRIAHIYFLSVKGRKNLVWIDDLANVLYTPLHII